MSKFVGKFRKNRNYNDDYNYDYKRHRNEHSEIKKLLTQQQDEMLEDEFNSPEDLGWEPNDPIIQIDK